MLMLRYSGVSESHISSSASPESSSSSDLWEGVEREVVREERGGMEG